MTSSIIGGKLCRCRPFGHYTRTTETKRARSSVTRALASSATFTEADTLEEDIHPAYKKYRYKAYDAKERLHGKVPTLCRLAIHISRASCRITMQTNQIFMCRTVFEHNSSQLRQIERDEAHNVILPEPTAQSMFNYVLGCIKFMLIPRPIRYLWYHIWVRLRSAYYPYHRKLVLKGNALK